jgi:hypothetical protein
MEALIRDAQATKTAYISLISRILREGRSKVVPKVSAVGFLRYRL